MITEEEDEVDGAKYPIAWHGIALNLPLMTIY